MDFDFEFFWMLAQVWAGIAIITLIALWLLREEDKPHWSEEDWWVNRHQRRFDDLHDDDPDKPNLFREEQ